MVHIRRLEIFGFKSFGFKNTILDFEDGLVTISGLNDSGKTNLLDAVRFALGENKPKILRAENVQSLIHDTSPENGLKACRTSVEFDNRRVIPTKIKQEVWKRDGGKCVKCGAKDNLHFDHVIPHSKGGTSITSENIQILCARHNLEKRDNIV